MSPRRITAEYDCVPVFVERSLKRLGYLDIDVGTVARGLGIRVLPDAPNPWKLEVTTEPDDVGVSFTNALRLIPHVVTKSNDRLGFRIIRFRDVWGQMVDDLAISALQRGCALGLGYNWARLALQTGTLRHVSTISRADIRGLTLEEHSTEARNGGIAMAWNAAWAATGDVDGGYWMIGPTASLTFDLAPQWPMTTTPFTD